MRYSTLRHGHQALAWPSAVLPYLRSAYNAYFERVWAKKEKQWIREVQPRADSQDDTGDQAEEDAGQAAAPADDDNIFEVRIDGGIWEDWEGNNGDDNIPAEAQAPAAPDNEGNLPQDQEMLSPLLLTLLTTALLNLQAYKHKHKHNHNKMNAAYPSLPRQ